MTETKLIFIDPNVPQEFARVRLPADESDPLWDHRQLLKLDPPLQQSVEEKGVLRPINATMTAEGFIAPYDGKTRWRHVEAAVKKGVKLPPVPFFITVADDAVDTMGVSLLLNEQQRRSDPITLGKTFLRLLEAGHTEAEISKFSGKSVAAVNDTMALLALPERVQQLILSGKLAVTTAAAIAKLDANEIEDKADKLVAAATEGKITGKAAALAAGKGDGMDRLSAKKIKTLIDEVNAETLAGPHAATVKKAFIAALEVVLDVRKSKVVWDVLTALARKG